MSGNDWRELYDENAELRCRIQELEAERDELAAENAELTWLADHLAQIGQVAFAAWQKAEQPERRPISFGRIRRPGEPR